MTVGTRSVLFGAHQFLLHPWFVAWGWWRLFGFPFDPRLWVAFFVHDLGYIGKPNMDGHEGEKHPEFGARIMSRLFDRRESAEHTERLGKLFSPGPWGRFSLYHSRFYARRHKAEPSRLCYADKLSIVLTPAWLYLPMARRTGELAEYMAPKHHEAGGKYEGERHRYTATPEDWYRSVQEFLERWIADELGRPVTGHGDEPAPWWWWALLMALAAVPVLLNALEGVFTW